MDLTKDIRQKIEALFMQHSKAMVQFAYRKLEDSHLAEEMVQKTFEEACKHPDKISGDKAVGWLYGTLKNIIKREKERAYHKMETSEFDDEKLGSVEMDEPMELRLPKGLTKRERGLILARVGKDLSYKEISELFGLSQDASRQAYNRAKKRCQYLFGKDPAK